MNQEQIRQAQQRLKEAGFDPGPIDGHFGPQTQAALREFQSAHGLPETGQLDQSTRARLMDQEMGGSPSRAMPGARSSDEPQPAPSSPGGISPGGTSPGR
jgi:peptidoglycan hydrolase-like protein with peptidoglycan-binding domain